MTSKTMPGRIAAEDVGDVHSWLMPPVTDGGRVLSSAEKEAKERKQKLLQQGKETIENIEIPAPPKAGISASDVQEIFDAAEKEGFAQGHKAGFDQGNAAGYEAGKQQGLMEMRALLTAEQQRFQQLAQQLLQPISEQDNDVETMLLDIICTLTQSVVQRELLTDSSQILEIVKTAMDALPIGSKNIRISLNPADIVAVEEYAGAQQLDWKFLEDPSLLPGGCRIETPESRVDFSVSTRLQHVLEQFLTQQLTQLDSDDNDDAL